MRALQFDDDTSGMLSELSCPNYKAVQQENPIQIWAAVIGNEVEGKGKKKKEDKGRRLKMKGGKKEEK